MALQEVVALVVSEDPMNSGKRGIEARLALLGARVAQRWSRDLTHVVFERARDLGRPRGTYCPDDNLLALYKRVEKAR